MKRPAIRYRTNHPLLLLMDGVKTALDPVLINDVPTAVRDLKSDGVTMVLATNEVGFATQVADEVCFLESGSTVEYRSTEQILQNSKTQEFLQRVHQVGRL
jgi:polar amino acid transport system ATP-binding protein